MRSQIIHSGSVQFFKLSSIVFQSISNSATFSPRELFDQSCSLVSIALPMVMEKRKGMKERDGG